MTAMNGIDSHLWYGWVQTLGPIVDNDCRGLACPQVVERWVRDVFLWLEDMWNIWRRHKWAKLELYNLCAIFCSKRVPFPLQWTAVECNALTAAIRHSVRSVVVGDTADRVVSLVVPVSPLSTIAGLALTPPVVPTLRMFCSAVQFQSWSERRVALLSYILFVSYDQKTEIQVLLAE